MPYEVLLVDDHKIMRDGIKAILRHAEDFRVMGDAETGVEAVQICRHARPDVILMDIGLPGSERDRDHTGDSALFPRSESRHPVHVR